MSIDNRKIILITRKTRLEELIQRFHTEAQAKFYIENLGDESSKRFNDYQTEHLAYQQAKSILLEALDQHPRKQIIDRHYLPNFVFAESDVVLALGQDGLVANTLKYLTGQPLIGINPDPTRYDGILLPFNPKDIKRILQEVLLDKREAKSITMAEAKLNDGQSMLAVNDLFIGAKSHISARYEISYNGKTENQSSSGIIVATGLGSSGWMKSIITSSTHIAQACGYSINEVEYQNTDWSAQHLTFLVREPFPSQYTQNSIIFGQVTTNKPLIISSKMPESAVIFSDGIEDDFINFNAGAIAKIELSKKHGRLVI